MRTGYFELFGAVHLAILASIPLGAVLLIGVARAFPELLPRLRVGCGVALLATLLSWHCWLLWNDWAQAAGLLPLQLCDAALLVTAAGAVTMRPGLRTLSYYWSLAPLLGSAFPVLWEPFPTWGTAHYFIGHCGTVSASLFLAAAPQPAPTLAMGPLGAFAALNVYGVFIVWFNWVFETNYMFLRFTPDGGRVLGLLGPWPYYVIAGEAITLVGFFALFLLHHIVRVRRGSIPIRQLVYPLVSGIRSGKGWRVRTGTLPRGITS